MCHGFFTLLTTRLACRLTLYTILLLCLLACFFCCIILSFGCWMFGGRCVDQESTLVTYLPNWEYNISRTKCWIFSSSNQALQLQLLQIKSLMYSGIAVERYHRRKAASRHLMTQYWYILRTLKSVLEAYWTSSERSFLQSFTLQRHKFNGTRDLLTKRTRHQDD